MNSFAFIAPAVATVFGTIVLAVLLRRTGFPSSDHAPIFSKLILEVALPAQIFVNLAEGAIGECMLRPALLMLLAEMGVLAIAWAAGLAMRLERRQMGSFLLASTFGSSAIIGYTLARALFPGNAEAMLETTIITELGVGLGVFTVGVFIASRYGSGGNAGDATVGFLKSRIFIALVAGLLWSLLGLPRDFPPIRVTFDVFKLFGEGLPILAALAVGLMLKPVRVKAVLPMLVGCALLKLILQPTLAGLIAGAASVAEAHRDLLIIMAAMPSGTVAAVLAAKYDCDGPLASALVVATTVLGALSVAVVFAAIA